MGEEGDCKGSPDSLRRRDLRRWGLGFGVLAVVVVVVVFTCLPVPTLILGFKSYVEESPLVLQKSLLVRCVFCKDGEISTLWCNVLNNAFIS